MYVDATLERERPRTFSIGHGDEGEDCLFVVCFTGARGMAPSTCIVLSLNDLDRLNNIVITIIPSP